jgi:arylsulfatase A-like enzyme
MRWWQSGGRLRRKGYAALAVTGVALTGISAQSMLPAAKPAPSAKPNVILIGLDSMRADLLDERISPHASPHIAAFMKSGVHFSNAMTPLARTYPSMMSMLTGRQPHRTGAVMNLLPRDLIDDSESLPRILARAGYKTAYATDETRFSNIDGSYGFSQVISPPIGVSDFTITKLADAPLTNLLVNTRLASWLFPNLHANRGAANTYDPDKFVARLDRELAADQPLFLTVHLTLAHWPYYWKGVAYQPKNTGEIPRWPGYYLRTIKRVDQQFADVLAMLGKKGLLENAIVVVYSDHGESFNSPDEALVPDHDPLIGNAR